MPSFIGNNIAFNGRGVVGADLILPDEYDYLGNGSSLFAKILRFSVGTHARASDAYMLAKNPSSGLYEMTGPFTSNVLATRNIGGEIGGVFEGQFATENTYSEVFRAAISDWSENNINISDNQATAPWGDTVADLLYAESSAAAQHHIQKQITTDGSSFYIISALIKKKEYKAVRLYANSAGFVGNVFADFDSDTLSISNETNTELTNILDLDDDWALAVMGATSNASAATYFRINILNTAGDYIFDGDGSSGLYLVGYNVIKIEHWTNYIKAVSAVAIKPADYFYWNSSLIPNWFKDEFTVKMIPNYDYPSQISIDKPIWSFQKTPVTVSTGNGYGGLTINDTYLYWTNDGDAYIQRMNLSTGSIDNLITSGLSSPSSVAVDSTYIYITDLGDGKIKRALLDGSGLTDLVTGLTTPEGICVDSTYVFWVDNGTQKVQRSLLDGSSVTDLATSLGLYAHKIDEHEDYLYFTYGGVLKRIGKDGSGLTNLITPGGTLRDVKYYANGNSLILSTSLNTILHVSLDTLAYTTIFSDSTIYYLVVGDNYTIWYTYPSGETVARVDYVTAWLATDGKIKVIDGPDTKVETDALSCDMHDEVTIEFNRGDGEIKTEGFTGDDTFIGSSWTSPDGYDVQYGGALKGAASSDGILFEPRG